MTDESETASLPQASAPVLQAFDCDALEPPQADLIRRRASEFGDFYRNIVIGALKTGIALLEVDDLLEQGQIKAWLQAKSNWASRERTDIWEALLGHLAADPTQCRMKLNTVFSDNIISIPQRKVDHP